MGINAHLENETLKQYYDIIHFVIKLREEISKMQHDIEIKEDMLQCLLYKAGVLDERLLNLSEMKDVQK